MAKTKTTNAVPKTVKVKQKATVGKGKKVAEKRGPEFFRNIRVITPDLMEDYKQMEVESYVKFKEREEKRIAEYKQAMISRKIELEEKQKVEYWVPGLVFNPSDELLINHYLKNKTLGKDNICPIDEVDVYGSHPQTLTEKYNPKDGVWYFFTRCRPTENPNVEGQWEIRGKNDVFDNGVKVGVRQELEYCDENVSTKYKMIEYQLNPAPSTTVPLFMCKLHRLQWQCV
ncbi:hypothetical protein ACHQM5_005082 [Ranunculus cassubicifolius]